MTNEIDCGEHVPLSEREQALQEVIEFCEAMMKAEEKDTNRGRVLMNPTIYFSVKQVRDYCQLLNKKAPSDKDGAKTTKR